MMQDNWEQMPEHKERIPIEQFRLGNLIFYKGELCRIISLDYDLDDESIPLIGIQILKHHMRGKTETVLEEHWTGNFTYIPITPEILKKCGFVDDGGITNSYSMMLPSLQRQFKSLSIGWCNDSSDHKWYAFFRDGDKDKPRESDEVVCLMRNMNYLHQLQNLYFSLTQNELKIEL